MLPAYIVQRWVDRRLLDGPIDNSPPWLRSELNKEEARARQMPFKKAEPKADSKPKRRKMSPKRRWA
jgi:hypothetical protein